jgi:Nucleoside-diphosphate-sugar pyrophosphorylase involved in lipopolysaccharide biosynthesis/translation initiation factor 2B, gamma/epsilon subunits (eIF-2Bgamma/eIF-2Bepsilon)
MQHPTSKKAKPSLEIGGITLLERAINPTTNHGVEEISIKIQHVGHQSEKVIKNPKAKVKIKIPKEKNQELETGGGEKRGIKNKKKIPRGKKNQKQ